MFSVALNRKLIGSDYLEACTATGETCTTAAGKPRRDAPFERSNAKDRAHTQKCRHNRGFPIAMVQVVLQRRLRKVVQNTTDLL